MHISEVDIMDNSRTAYGAWTERERGSGEREGERERERGRERERERGRERGRERECHIERDKEIK